ncbi:MAG: hypothetical protein ABH835_01200 [Patescibacteria group bacterium]
MPKIKTHKQKISSTTINFIILFVLVIFLGAGLYGFYYFYFQIKSEEIESLADSRSELTENVVIKKLNVEELADNGYFELQEHGVMEYGEQNQIIGKDAAEPPHLIDVKIINPKIGRELVLTWQAPDWSEVTSVDIYRSQEDGKIGEIIAEKQNPTGSYMDNGVEDNKTYYYTFVSQIGEYKSMKNKQYWATVTDELPPEIPNDVILENMKNGDIRITWSRPPDSDLAYYNVYRSQVSGSIGGVVGEKISVEEYIDETENINEKYYYLITSVDKVGNESARTLAVVPSGNKQPFGSEIPQ